MTPSPAPLPPAQLDRLAAAYFEAWHGGDGPAWRDVPEEGRARFRAIALDMVARAGLASALAAWDPGP